MKLKNIALSSIIAATMMSGYAHAADHGDVSFLGAVSAKTCDIEAVVDGAVKNLVQLGTVTVGGPNSEKEFELRLKDPATCDLTGTPAAFVTWNSGSFNATGLANANGTAKDAVVKLAAVNAKTANTEINSSATDVEFVSNQIKTDGGFKFKATLIPGTQKGTVDTAAAFAVRYE
ncbi:TPA: fimbrial protein [Escherichia coli]|uniref:fimbrial protein n=1 Tax=Escherichia coli TaxID=562 RepID=UPI0017F764D0|nr:fimbrial protein [Escherichia coli]EJK1708405.1 fimbrial protein [Escherichia coli]HAW1538872.1 fimbrial protein [Escherichia coli]HBB2006196.1 fimbrial protein [Escherichia coli]HCO7665330.1 fimbrial protein [Escherichia coli]